ncbi:hypothetical protein ANCCAN_22151, partial [Ancylostoma caninum]
KKDKEKAASPKAKKSEKKEPEASKEGEKPKEKIDKSTEKTADKVEKDKSLDRSADKSLMGTKQTEPTLSEQKKEVNQEGVIPLSKIASRTASAKRKLCSDEFSEYSYIFTFRELAQTLPKKKHKCCTIL